MDSNIVHRNRLNAEPVLAFHLQAIHADVLYVLVVPVVGITADDAGFVDVETAVALIEPKQRQQ